MLSQEIFLNADYGEDFLGLIFTINFTLYMVDKWTKGKKNAILGSRIYVLYSCNIIESIIIVV